MQIIREYRKAACAAIIASGLLAPSGAVASDLDHEPRGEPAQLAKYAKAPPPGARCSAGTRATACFIRHGDVMWIKDLRADGYAADVSYTVTEDGQGTEVHARGHCVNRLGKKAGWALCNYNFPEKKHIAYQAAAVHKNGNPVTDGSAGNWTFDTT